MVIAPCSATLQIIMPVLGPRIDYDARHGCFDRDHDGRVLLLPSWWHKPLQYGAKAVGRYQSRIKQVRFDPVVRCNITTHQRQTGDGKYIDHEAIDKAFVVTMNVPSDFDLSVLREILDIGGRFAGLTPFRWHEDYGRFRCLDVGRDL